MAVLRLLTVTIALGSAGSAALWAVPAVAQNRSLQSDGYFSPTYAASAQGSPYREVYSRTFGSAAPPPPDPQETAATLVPSKPVEDFVFVIDSKGLATYRADDYGDGQGAAIARGPLPPVPEAKLIAGATAQVPTVADNLYLQPPLETAGGPQAAPPAVTPILLTPPPEAKTPDGSLGNR
ncbi:hypothetical protein [Pelagibius sp.]|uniref:hypothetical protein n=1 Tax=Pelagibius sp. TaxID=1931238 RepID=UPI00262A6356|nr:hypothetical protein [Pelagibius sp.]